MYPGPWHGPGHHVHEGLGWGGWLLWVLFMVALWALVIMAVVWLVRSFTHRGPMTAQRGTQVHGGAEQILAQRFAHGQIDENEYRSRLGVLRGEPMATPTPPQAQPPPPAPAAPPPAPPPEEQG